MKTSKYQWAIFFGIILVGLVAWIDIQGFNLLGEDYTNGLFGPEVWPHHLITVIILFLIPAILYWIFYRKDKSECLAIFLVPFTLFWTGMCDILYFWLQGEKIPKLLPWLDGNPIIGGISEFFGYSAVTGDALVLSSLTGIIFVSIIIKILHKRF